MKSLIIGIAILAIIGAFNSGCKHDEQIFKKIQIRIVDSLISYRMGDTLRLSIEIVNTDSTDIEIPLMLSSDNPLFGLWHINESGFLVNPEDALLDFESCGNETSLKPLIIKAGDSKKVIVNFLPYENHKRELGQENEYQLKYGKVAVKFEGERKVYNYSGQSFNYVIIKRIG
jgi:hypothetical protein